jgi:signal transduction histidine kinase
MNRAGPGLGLQRLVQGVWKPFATPALDGATLEVSTLFLDRDNGLWVGTTNQGIYRVYNGNVDHFRSADGLSSDSIFNFYQDREGDIWVATSKGIDSFRNLAVASFSIAEGLHADDVGSVLASRNGAVWIGNAGALDSLHEGKWFSIQRQNGLPGGKVTSLLEDRSGLLWIGVDNGLFVYEHGRFSAIRGQGGGLKGIVIAMTQDHNGDIWAELPGNPARLIRIRNRKVIETLTASQIPAAFTVMADPQDGLWVTPFEGGLARYRQDRLEMIPARGPTGAGTIYNLLADSGGTIWGAAKNALVGWRKGRIQVLSVANGLPCDHIYSIVSDSRNALWLYAQCGLITITRPELERWWAHPETTVKTRTFDVFDGVQAAPASFRPSAARSLDGRLWFANDSILQMIDPSHLEDNPVPPPVHVETIVADTKNYLPRGALRLPPLTRDIEINYTALSFVTPQRVRFRYKLEGHDAVWQEAAARRSAFYMNLSPARYRFHVIACNNDGVWNERGAVLDFTIPPAWYQTVWSKVVGLLAVCALCYLLYRRKVRQVAASLKIRFDERLEERTRLARDLHDTLIQTIQGSKMVADNAREEPDDLARMQKAVDLLAEWLGRAILEGWAALASLRSSTTEGNDLAESLRQAGDDGRIKTLIDVSVSLRGKSKEMHPIARDEVYRIGYEAIQNACAHSGGTHVSVELEYGQYLRLRVRDDGRGMDQNTLRFGKAGHFGLQGMRERAARIGGKLTLSSSQDKGTEVNLLVPGKVIFKQF